MGANMLFVVFSLCDSVLSILVEFGHGYVVLCVYLRTCLSPLIMSHGLSYEK